MFLSLEQFPTDSLKGKLVEITRCMLLICLSTPFGFPILNSGLASKASFPVNF